MMKKHPFYRTVRSFLLIVLGCVLFAVGFDLFLQPNQTNVGGVSGIGQLLAHVTGVGSVAIWSLCINVPLFLISIKGVGREFFLGSLVGMLCLNLSLELLNAVPAPVTDPLLAALYGGLCCGAGSGLVFIAGASTGGVDILGRMLRPIFPAMPIGKIILCMDLITITLTGFVFGDISKALYSAVTLYVCSVALDGVVYGLDYSTVALIVSDHHEAIAAAINNQMERGVTILDGHGYYSGQSKQVILSAIKKRQVAELKNLVTELDPDAFIILQESHQVLGEGFKRYNKNDL